jgi:hypothetical protein
LIRENGGGTRQSSRKRLNGVSDASFKDSFLCNGTATIEDMYKEIDETKHIK